MHLVSEVSGTLREDQTRFDAFRSIFPAGTVSGAPKVKAMELIAEWKRKKRCLCWCCWPLGIRWENYGHLYRIAYHGV